MFCGTKSSTLKQYSLEVYITWELLVKGVAVIKNGVMSSEVLCASKIKTHTQRTGAITHVPSITLEKKSL